MKSFAMSLTLLILFSSHAIADGGSWDIVGVKLGDGFSSVASTIEKSFPEVDIEKTEGSLKNNNFTSDKLFFGFKTTANALLSRGDLRGVINYKDQKSITAFLRIADYSNMSVQPSAESIRAALIDKYGKCTYDRFSNGECAMVWTKDVPQKNFEERFFVSNTADWITSLSNGKLSDNKITSGTALCVTFYYDNNKIVTKFTSFIVDFKAVHQSIIDINDLMTKGSSQKNNETQQKGSQVKPAL